MLRIRLWRMGKRKRPLYRLVVTERKTAAQGAYQEALGNFDPHTKTLNLNKEKVLFWLNKGAKPSDSAAKLLSKEGLKHSLIVVKKFPPRPKKAKEQKEEKLTTVQETKSEGATETQKEETEVQSETEEKPSKETEIQSA